MSNASTKRILLSIGLSTLGFYSTSGFADQFHNHNLIIGTRAVGMGGAFGAIADDASGIYYNPAGLAFALSNDISGSANAYYNKETTYKKTIGDDDFVESSAGSVPSFFGGLQKLDRYVPGLVFAFGVYSTDNDLKDQDSLIEAKQVKQVYIERYHRTSNARANTYFAGAGVGMRVTPNLALGFSAHYFNADELVQEYQYARQTNVINLGGVTQNGWLYSVQNVRERLVVHGIQPALGVQAALPANIAAGLTVKKGFIASQRLEIFSERDVFNMSQAQKEAFDTTGVAICNDGTATQHCNIYEDAKRETVKKPIGEWPTEVRAAFAWFASPTFLMALDAIYHSEVKKSAPISINGGAARYDREAVIDYALGVEYYVAAAFPLRFGVFTNNDSRPKVDKKAPDAASRMTCEQDPAYKAKFCGQPDHIDYVGESLFISWVQPNSQVSVGLVLQQGSGDAQKLGDHQVQKVEASSTTFAFSATHNL